MKRWAFVDCFHTVNFENFDFEGYERVVLFTSGNLLIPVGEVDPTLELAVIRVESLTQEQMTVALAYHVGRYDVETPSNIHFDIYSNDIESPSFEDCLRNAGRHCEPFTLPPNDKITLSKAVDNFIHHVNISDADKRERPRSLSVYSRLLDWEWRSLRGRVKTEELLKELDRMGLIRRASNGVYFSF